MFWRIVLPLTLPALIAGLIINFIMNMTAFAIPMLLGGVRNMVVSMLAYQLDLVSLDWPLGGALAVALLVFTLALVWAGQRIAVFGIAGRAAQDMILAINILMLVVVLAPVVLVMWMSFTPTATFDVAA